MQDLVAEFERAKIMLTGMLKTKLDFWKRLPWLLCGVAVADESRAREVAAEALQKFSQDPRQEAHHRLTWELMRPGAEFRHQLQLFVDGQVRSALSQIFLERLGSFKMLPITETTIEARHAYASQALKSKGGKRLGPTRISLSNRLPQMEQQIRQGKLDVARLVHYFQTAQGEAHLAIPAALGLEGHPELHDLRCEDRPPGQLQTNQ